MSGITDPASAGALGANGLTLTESYQSVFNPKDLNSRPDMLPPPDYSIRMGPQNHLYLVLHSLPAKVSHLHLYCSDFPDEGTTVGPEFVIDLTLPSPTPKVLLIPPSKLVSGHHYEFALQIQDSSGRVSQPYQSPGAYGRREYHEFADFTSDIRRLVNWRLRFAGDASYFSAAPFWRYVGLPARSTAGVWVDAFLGQTYPRPPLTAPVYIGDFADLRWSDTTIYPSPDPDWDFWDWDLRNAGLSVSYVNDQGQYRYFLDWLSSSENAFGLPFTTFQFEFPDQWFTITPGGSVEVSYENAYERVASVYQTVEEGTTATTSFLFNYRGAYWGPGAVDYGFRPYPVTLCWPASPGVEGEDATAVENPTMIMNVEHLVRVTAFSKEAIKRANGDVIPNQFIYVQQYFDKTFRCDDVNGDVPRTTEDNIGGKKKIDIMQAVQSGLLSPYGDFTPTNTGKYILTTMPNEHGEYGECTIYVLPEEIVTRDPDEGVERPLDDTIYTTCPAPDVTLRLLSANINAQGALEIQVLARVVDRLSEVADDPSERLQQLKFILNGEEIEVIGNLPAFSPGSGLRPWQPYRLDVTLERTFTVPNPGGGAFILRAETSENAAGNVGRDEVAVSVGLEAVPFAPSAEPVTFAFSHNPSATTVDTFQVYFGDRAPQVSDPTSTETSAASLVFTGWLNVSGSLRACEARIFDPFLLSSDSPDILDAQITYVSGDGSSRCLVGHWSETGADTLRFTSAEVVSGALKPDLWHTEQGESAPKSSFEPILVRFSAPRTLTDTKEIVACLNEIPQPVAPFTFSPEKYYLVGRADDESKPRLLVVTAKELPPGLKGLKPDNVKITELGGDNFTVRVEHEGREIAGAKAEVFEDNFEIKPQLFGLSHPLTKDLLLTYFKLIYGEKGLTLLWYFEGGNGEVDLCDVEPNLQFSDFWRRDGKHVLQIEEDLSPVQAAVLLWNGLHAATRFRTVNEFIWAHHTDPSTEIELLQRRQQEYAKGAAEAMNGAMELYLMGLSIANEGADLAITLDELSKGHYASAIGFLPFVPAGTAKYVLKRTDGSVISEFTPELSKRIGAILKQRGFPSRMARIEKVRALRKLMDSGEVTKEMMRALIMSGELPCYDGGYCRRLLGENLIAKEIRPAADMRRPQPHHDLPVEFQEVFLVNGLDINDPRFGRWVEGGPIGNHQKWSREFNDAWRRKFAIWQAEVDGITAQKILQFVDELRESSKFQ